MSQLYPDYAWKDTALGGANRRNNVLRSDRLASAVPDDRRECYTSWARFTEELLNYCRETGSVRKYPGPAYSDFFWIDVDEKDANGDAGKLASSQYGASRIIQVLIAFAGVDPADIRIYFSGSKGFHIGVPTQTFGVEPSADMNRAFKIIAGRLAEQAEVKIDPSVYDKVRLWRLPNTVNGKTGLFKIPITWDELDDLDAILEMAKSAREGFEKTQNRPNTPNPLMASFYRQALQKVEDGVQPGRFELPVIQANAPPEWPKHDKMCIARMLQGVTNDRNTVAYRIAVHLRQKGMALDVADAAMQAWNRKNNPPMDAVEVSETTRKAFEYGHDFGCHDPTLDAYCHDTCHIYPQKVKDSNTLQKLESDILTVSEAQARYLAYTKERDLANTSWGIPWLDSVTRGVRPGQVGMVMARAGVGKTALINHIIKANSAKSVVSLFASLEQLAEDIYERMAQSVTELPGQVIEDGFYDGDEQFIGSVGTQVAAGFAHAYICDRDCLTVDQLKAYVKAAEQKAGQKIRLLCVDYLGRMKGTGKDNYEKISEVAKGLKNVAKECHLAVIVVVQLNRTAGRGTVEVEMDQARDSGQIEEAADYAIGMWKASGEERGSTHPVSITTSAGTVLAPQSENYYPVMVKVLKNRKGAAGDHVRNALMFRPDVMRFEDIHWNPKKAGLPPHDPETGEIFDTQF